ncbi:MAG TPA: protein phosphatase 2C domain-containing protein [Longimicrobiales bacterium]
MEATRTPAGWRSFSGRRKSNQDAVVAGRFEDGRELIAIADGMGGHQGGAVAAQQALDVLVETVRAGRGLREGMVAANAAVYRAAQEDPELTGMGTTLVALLRTGDSYSLANVGDSRAYLVSETEIRQVTADHSFLAEALRAGQMSAEEAKKSRWRNALTRAIGTDAQVEVDEFGPFEAQEPHSVILCSDGLHGSVPEDLLQQCVVQNRDVWAAAMCLADEAFRNGSKDNISVAVVRFGERIKVSVSGAPMAARHSPKSLRLLVAPEKQQRSLFRRLFTLFT